MRLANELRYRHTLGYEKYQQALLNVKEVPFSSALVKAELEEMTSVLEAVDNTIKEVEGTRKTRSSDTDRSKRREENLANTPVAPMPDIGLSVAREELSFGPYQRLLKLRKQFQAMKSDYAENQKRWSHKKREQTESELELMGVLIEAKEERFKVASLAETLEDAKKESARSQELSKDEEEDQLKRMKEAEVRTMRRIQSRRLARRRVSSMDDGEEIERDERHGRKKQKLGEMVAFALTEMSDGKKTEREAAVESNEVLNAAHALVQLSEEGDRMEAAKALMMLSQGFGN